MDLKKRLKDKKPILLDGAMGTELKRRGVDTALPLWSAKALITHPEVVCRIHEDYIKAGAEIITTNTFRTNIRTIRRSGSSKTAEELTQLAVRLAQKAREKAKRDVFIAGSIAPVEDCYSPELVPTSEELHQEHTALVNYLKEAGVDLFLIETMNTVTEAEMATRAACETGLPVFVSFVTGKDGDLLSGENLKAAVAAVEKYPICAILLNCFPVEYSLEPLKILSSATSLPHGIYAHGLGQPDNDQGWKFVSGKEVDEYLDYVRSWLDLGAKIIGGCCGTTPEYIEEIRSLWTRP